MGGAADRAGEQIPADDGAGLALRRAEGEAEGHAVLDGEETPGAETEFFFAVVEDERLNLTLHPDEHPPGRADLQTHSDDFVGGDMAPWKPRRMTSRVARPRARKSANPALNDSASNPTWI